ncbi:mCG147190 [Mus musculus]|nr:mCG147190 [Mus musculus]
MIHPGLTDLVEVRIVLIIYVLMGYFYCICFENFIQCI